MRSVSCELVRSLKIDLLRMFFHSHTGHLASSLSCIEILSVLYYGMKRNDDHIILSKGHGAAALYVILANQGMIAREELLTFYKKNSRLLALASNTIPGIAVPTGSLGQGICFATGVAKAYRMDNQTKRVYCIIGDGEMQEGSVWEAAMFAGNHNLSNMTVILDHNKIQASNNVLNIANVDPISQKWKAFGWNVYEVNGHDVNEIMEALCDMQECDDRPSIIIANTHKGNGISFLEDIWDCHMKNPQGDEWKQVCEAFNITVEDLESI